MPFLFVGLIFSPMRITSTRPTVSLPRLPCLRINLVQFSVLGCSPHWRKNCPNKKEGHKNEATLKNCMKGSNKNCKWYDRGATLLQKLYDKIYLGKKYFFKHLVTNVVTSSIPVMKADSGASQTFIKKEHSHFLQDLVPLNKGPEAILPDKSRIQASNKGSLSFSLPHNIKHLFFQH